MIEGEFLKRNTNDDAVYNDSLIFSREVGSNTLDKILICAICKNPICGMMVICQCCQHAFHQNHYVEWFNKNEKCPIIGCNHFCNHSQKTDFLMKQ